MVLKVSYKTYNKYIYGLFVLLERNKSETQFVTTKQGKLNIQK